MERNNIEIMNKKISLLFLKEKEEKYFDNECLEDFDFNNVLNLFTKDDNEKQLIREIITNIIDENTIKYRQNVIEDIINNPIILEKLENIIPSLEVLEGYYYEEMKKMRNENIEIENKFFENMWRMDELEEYIKCIGNLSEISKNSDIEISSNGLKELFSYTEEIQNSEIYNNLVKDIRGLSKIKDGISGFKIGVNLDTSLRAKEAVLLSIDDKNCEDQLFGNKIFGNSLGLNKEFVELSSAPKYGSFEGMHYSMNNFLKDISNIKKEEGQIIEKALEKYESIDTSMLGSLRKDIVFYTRILNMINKFKKIGLPISKPEIFDKSSKIFKVDEIYNLNLVEKNLDTSSFKLKIDIIRNDVDMSKEERIFVLTGPNSGGKTTYMEAIGITQILAQAGVFIPGKNAEISIVDNIYTHYPIEEETQKDTGKLGQESKRLREIFEKVTQYSFIFLNESFSSTSEIDGVYIAKEIIKALNLLGAKSIYTTHILSLLEEIDGINRDQNQNSIISMVAKLEKNKENRRSFKIEKSKPMESSFAKDIIKEYGIDYENLIRSKNEY